MVFCPPNSSWQHEIVQSCCKLVSGSGVKVGPAVFTRPAGEDPGLKTRASCEGWSMWMSSRGLGMLDCVAGCAVVELRLRSRCVDKAEMHFLQPFDNKRMLLRPSAVSRYAKKADCDTTHDTPAIRLPAAGRWTNAVRAVVYCWHHRVNALCTSRKNGSPAVIRFMG